MAQYDNAGGPRSVAAPASVPSLDNHPPSCSSTQQDLQGLQGLPGSQHKRVYQACIPCRRRKVRCDLGSVDNPHDPPCVRCRRESKECYFSATRRKRKTDETEERVEDDYVIRNGRKRLRAEGSPPPPLNRQLYSDVPLTPGGSMGRSHPLQRPGRPRSDSRSSFTAPSISRGRSAGEFAGDEPNTPLENFEARTVMRREVYGPHDALDLLYKAATDNKHDDAGHVRSAGPQPAMGISTQPLSAAMGNLPQASARMDYARQPAVHPGQMEAPIDPQLIKSEQEQEQVPVPAHADALKAWTRFRFVRAGWFTAQEAIDYIDYYYTYLSPLTPISPPTFQDPASHLTLLTEEPILAVTLLTIASRYRKLPGIGGKCRSYAIHEQLWTYLRGMIERVIWGQEAFGGGFCGSGSDESQTSSTAPWRGLRKGSLRTLGTIESLMILTEWHPRALHFPPAEAVDELMLPVYDAVPSNGDDNGDDGNQRLPIGMGGKRIESWLEPAWRSDRMCWMLLTTAMGLGYELGVFDNIEEMLAQGAVSRPEYQEEGYRLRASRIRRLTLIYLSQLAGRLGWTSMVPENLRKSAALARRRPTSVEGTTPGTNMSSVSASFNYIPDLELDDQIIHCWAGISNAMHAGNEKLFKSREHTTEIIQSGRYIGLLKEFQPMLRDWLKEFERFRLPPYIRHILTIEYEYVRIYVNSLALQAVVERCTSYAAGTSVTGPANNGSATSVGPQLSPKTQDVYGKMPLGQLGRFGPDDQEYVKEVVDGSRNLLRTVVEGLLPGDYLKHAPVRTYFRIISGAMFLLKTFALGATRSDVELSIGLMDSTVHALRTCVVDDVHLGVRFADLLENLTSRLRHRFKHVPPPPTQAASQQTTATDGRSPVLGAAVPAGVNGHNGMHMNGHDHGVWGRLRDGGAGQGKNNPSSQTGSFDPVSNPMAERAMTPANVSSTPFDLGSGSFPMPPNFGGPATPAATAGAAATMGPSDQNNGATGASAVPDMFGDGAEWDPGNEVWYLPPGPAFFSNIGGDSSVGMSAEGINYGMDLLDYMAMDQYPAGDGNNNNNNL